MLGTSLATGSDDRRMVLTAEQEAFVRHQQGPAILHAPVGTGKTLCLAERAAVAIRRGVPASRILCVTFTNLASEQMGKRVQARCGKAGAGIVVRTFHSLCAWILRSEAKVVGIPADFVIFDEDDGEELLRTLLLSR